MAETELEFVKRMAGMADIPTVRNDLAISLRVTFDGLDLLFALARRGAEAGWRPIETAPRLPRHEILMWDRERRFVGWWKSGTFWRDIHNPFNATHWMPLPSAPGEVKG